MSDPDRLPRRDTAESATAWWLGVHGGAGETTLAKLADGSRPANHTWPLPQLPGITHRVVLVARNNHTGLIAAQNAAIEWASDSLGDGIQLHGLVLIADAPGRRPKLLSELEQVVVGGVPHVWNLPWVEPWRVSGPHAQLALPKPFTQLLADLSLTTSAPR